MKKIYYLTALIFLFISCSETVTLNEIPLTSTSDEAKKLFTSTIFKPEEGYRLYRPASNEVINEILKLDPGFLLADVMQAYFFNSGSIDERRNRIINAFDKRDSVTEIERALITQMYEDRISGNILKAQNILNDIVKKYSDYYYLWIYKGNFENFRLLSPNESKISWEKALEIDPENSLAKLLLAQLHFVTTPDFMLLGEDEINLDEAVKLIKEVQKKELQNPTCPRLLGNIYRARGDFDLSLEEYNKAMNLIEDKESWEYSQLVLVSGHNYLFKKEYDKSREFYQKSIDINKEFPQFDVNVTSWLSNTYLYEKKYNESIKTINSLEERIKSNDEIEDIRLYGHLIRIDRERFITYGHSQMKDEAFQSLNNINNHFDKLKALRIELASSENEISRIELDVEISKGFHKIWYLILFGEYENALNELKLYSQTSSEFLIFDPKAMISFYKLSGYLNLMSGNIDESISFYNQVPRELLEGDNYHLYFYALALKAKGNINESSSLFSYLSNYNFAGWDNSIVRSLAQNQLKT